MTVDDLLGRRLPDIDTGIVALQSMSEPGLKLDRHQGHSGPAPEECSGHWTGARTKFDQVIGARRGVGHGVGEMTRGGNERTGGTRISQHRKQELHGH